MIGTTVSHYRILEELGGGGMGVVYKAEDTKLGRPVALKFLGDELSRDPEAIKRFQREARAASSLNHPNICTIHDIDEHEGRQFIVMELMEGQTLKHRIGDKPMATEEIVALAGQITEGLAAAHARGIIHRDIKPANLFVTDGGLVKVLDFGVAKLLPREEDATLTGTQTAGGAALGTLAYMAPEQLNREAVDARTDLYALGCVLYEMATGQRPFQNELGAQRITSILTRMPEPPSKLNPGVPAWLDAVILKCLEKEPRRRYQSAKELQADLRRLAAPAVSVPAPSPQAPAWGRTGSRWRVPPGSAWKAAVVLAGIAATVAALLGLDVGGWRTRLLGSPTPKIDSIAVLPLKNLSGDPEQDYFVEGMHEALTAELSKISALKVISRTSTMQYKGVTKSLPQVARELGVAGVIEGSVLREGDQVRITVQLIHGPSDRNLWAQTFDRELRGILALHSEVAQAIANEIKITLTPQERASVARTRPVNPEAYEYYLRGRFYADKRTPEGLKRGLEYFQRAIDSDPRHALAYVGLADTYRAMGGYSVLPANEAYSRAKAALDNALELDDTSAETHNSLANAYLDDFDWQAAEREFRRALELNPNYPTTVHQYAAYLGASGRFEEAIKEIRRARELDPLSPVIRGAQLGILFHARKYDETIAESQKALEADPPFLYFHKGAAYIEKGMLEKGLAEFEQQAAVSPTPPVKARLGYAYGRAGRRAEAVRIAGDLEELSKREHVSSYDIALVHAGLGDKAKSLAWLERAYEKKEGVMWLLFLRVSPCFDSLRDDPRFQDLLRRMNFPE